MLCGHNKLEMCSEPSIPMDLLWGFSFHIFFQELEPQLSGATQHPWGSGADLGTPTETGGGVVLQIFLAKSHNPAESPCIGTVFLSQLRVTKTTGTAGRGRFCDLEGINCSRFSEAQFLH